MSVSGKRGALVFALFSLVFSVYMLVPSGKIIALVIACVAAPFCACLLIIPSKRKVFAAVAAILCAVSSFAGFFFARGYSGKKTSLESLADDRNHNIAATVEKTIYSKPFGSAYYLTASTVDGERLTLGIYLEIAYAGDFSEGDEISFSSALTLTDEDSRQLLRSKNIFLCAEADEAYVVSVGGKLTVADRINNFFDGVFHDKLTTDAADFASAVFLGNSGNIASRVKLSFRRAGVSHLLALSGLHLSVIVLGIDFVLRAAKVKKRARIIALLLSTFGFAVMTGLSLSVFRAALMLALYYLAQFFGEESDSLTALFFSLALILIIRPCAVWDAGLWMSFSATLGLICFSGVLIPKFAPSTRKSHSKKRKFFVSAAKYVAGLFTANIVATLFTLPVTYLVFGGVSLISPLSNLLLVPLVQIILYLLFLLCALFYIPVLSFVIAFAVEKLIALSTFIAERFSSIDGVYISVKYPFTPYLIAGLFICVLLAVFVKKIKPKYIFAAAAALCFVFAGCLFIYSKATENELRAVCVNEKSSDAVGLVYRGKSIVIDISTGGFAASYKTACETNGYAAAEIDAYVLTHLHTYHIHTLEKLCGYVRIDRILLPSAESDSDAEILAGLIETAEENDIEIIFYDRGVKSYLDCGNLTLALPEYVTLDRSTHPVIAFSAELDGKRVLSYAGSACFEALGETPYENACAVIFGSHGPIEKLPPDVSLCDVCACLIFMNEKTYVASDMPDGAVIVSEHGGMMTVLFKKQS